LRSLFIFIDGIGLGKCDSENPFEINDTPGISRVLGGHRLTTDAVNYIGPHATMLGLDAVMGVPGLPQSATGQASIFTGVNAPAFLGGHLNGFPDEALRMLLASKGWFKQLKKAGFRVSFANAYRPPFFDLLRRGLPGNRYSCSTLITYYGGLHFHGFDDLRAGRALYMDITNKILQRMGYDVLQITPEEGAERLLNISRFYHFTLFEYFLSDLAGHLGDHAEAGRVINDLDRFIGTLYELINPEEELIIITSDHGNLEDLASKDHTLNKVPALLIGDQLLRRDLQPLLADLTDFLPVVRKTLEWGNNKELSLKKQRGS